MEGRHITSAAAVLLLLVFSAWTPLRAQAPTAPQIADAQVYDGFVTWIKAQPSIRDLPTALERYRQILAEQGLERPEIERRIQMIVQSRIGLYLMSSNPVLRQEQMATLPESDSALDAAVPASLKTAGSVGTVSEELLATSAR
jgi:hypothetical protein